MLVCSLLFLRVGQRQIHVFFFVLFNAWARSSLWQWWNWNSTGAVLLVLSAGFSAEVQARTNLTLPSSRERPSGLSSSVLMALGSHCWAQYLQTLNSGYSIGMLQQVCKLEGAARIYACLLFCWRLEIEISVKGGRHENEINYLHLKGGRNLSKYLKRY